MKILFFNQFLWVSIFLDEWSIKKNYCTVFDAQWGSSEDKKKSSYYEECTSWKNEMSSVTIYHGTSKDSGQKNFCSTNSTDFQIDWLDFNSIWRAFALTENSCY